MYSRRTQYIFYCNKGGSLLQYHRQLGPQLPMHATGFSRNYVFEDAQSPICDSYTSFAFFVCIAAIQVDLDHCTLRVDSMLVASCYVAKPFLINMNVHVPARKVSNSYCSTYQVADVILIYFVTSFFFG